MSAKAALNSNAITTQPDCEAAMTQDEIINAAAERQEMKDIIGQNKQAANSNFKEPWQVMGEVFDTLFATVEKK